MKSGRKSFVLWAGLAGILLSAALACNFPFGPRRPANLSPEEFKATLTALAPAVSAVPVLTQIPESSNSLGATATIPPPAPPGYIGYFTQPGDTLPALAMRFGVSPEEILAAQPLPAEAYLPAGLALNIPDRLGETLPAAALIPDSAVVYSPGAAGFDIAAYIQSTGGFLSSYSETSGGETRSAAEIIYKVAAENSISPQLLLAFLELRSGWVLGQPKDPANMRQPIGFSVPDYNGLYKELILTATHLGIGYYGWRSGELTTLKFPDDRLGRVNPGQNAGSVALQNLFAKFYRQDEWERALYGSGGLIEIYREMFGDPWARAAEVGSVLPDDLAQPVLELPFAPGERWSFSGGPHLTWNSGSPQGALDFSPVEGGSPCTASTAWVTAAAAGLVARSSDDALVLDLDGDGFEGSGWALLYLHIPDADRVPAGTEVALDRRLGHPSCDRGQSTGTHVHLARKYNGEWIPADGPLPFVLSGWETQAGLKSYGGTLMKGDQVVTANPGGSSISIIVR